MRKLTEFKFYKNTPLVDLKNTIYFKSNKERNDFFTSNYEYLDFKIPFNFIVDRSTLRLKGDYKEFKEVNYCSFISEFDDIEYFCFIPEYKYLNDGTIELNLLIDGIMTFCQGSILDDLKGITITRQHLNKADYIKNIDYIKNNDDVIKTYTKRYILDKKVEFKDFNILIQSTTNLSKSFGTEDNPSITSSNGCIFDKISSPVDLYIVKESEFNKAMEKLAPYPWITQNFKKIVQIPSEILDLNNNNIKAVSIINPDLDLREFKKIVGGNTSSINNFLAGIEFDYNTLLQLFKIPLSDEHLFRSEYTTIELYNWAGQSIVLDSGLLNRDIGLKFGVISVGGYSNELAIYIKGYKGSTKELNSFLNDSLAFKDFDDVPILIDNYSLAMSKSANQRALTESNLLTGKIKRIVGKDNNIQDRLIASVSIISNLSPMKIGQGLVDEYEFYRNQKANEKDLALTPAGATPQTTSNALARNNNFYGVNLKLSCINDIEMKKISNYYKLYGYELEESNSRLSDTRSMTICNYVEFKGSFFIKGIERSILDIIKIQFENGVRLWHNKNIPYPFNQDITKNTIRV